MKNGGSERVIRTIALCFATALAVVIISGIVYTGCFILRVVGFVAGEEAGGTITYSEEFSGVTSLYLDCEVGEIIIRQGSDDAVRVEAKNAESKLQTNQSGNALTVGLKDHNFFSFLSQSVLIITVPEDAILEELTVKVDLGRVVLEDISVQRLTAKSDLGSVEAERLHTSDSTLMEVGLGMLRVRNSTLKNPDLKGGLGLVEVKGDLSGSGRAEIGIGALELSLQGSREDYELVMDMGLGGSNLESYTGPYASNAAKLLLKNGIGGATVQFYQ